MDVEVADLPEGDSIVIDYIDDFSLHLVQTDHNQVHLFVFQNQTNLAQFCHEVAEWLSTNYVPDANTSIGVSCHKSHVLGV